MHKSRVQFSSQKSQLPDKIFAQLKQPKTAFSINHTVQTTKCHIPNVFEYFVHKAREDGWCAIQR